MPEIMDEIKKTSLDKINRNEPKAWEAIFFTEPDFGGDAYLAQLGYAVDFGKALLALPDPLNDTLKSVKTGRLCKLKLYADYSYEGDLEIVPGNSEIPKIRIGLTSFTAGIEEDQISTSIKAELKDNEEKIKELKDSLEICGKDKKYFKDRLDQTELELQKYKDKLEICEGKGKDLQDQLDNKKLDEINALKDKLKDCEENSKKLKELLEDSKLNKVDDLKDQLKECEDKGKALKDQLGKSEKEKESLIGRLLGKKEEKE